MSNTNIKRLSEVQGAILALLGLGIDYADASAMARVLHDGQALRVYGEDPTLNSPPEVSAPFGVVLQPKIALTANQATRAGLLTLDTVTLAAGDIVLLTAQGTASQNGPWVVNANDSSGNATNWTRPKLPLFSGQQYHVQAGTESGKTWRLSTVGTITLDTTSLTYDRINTGGAGVAFDPASPGTIGGTTPGAGNFTSLTATTNITLAKEANHTISVAASTSAATAGGNLTIQSGNGNGAAGGALALDTGGGTAGGAITLGGTNAATVAIGRAAGAIGLYGVTPVARAGAYTQTYSTAARTVPAALTDSTTGTPGTTLALVGATNAGDVSGAINNNFASLNACMLEAFKLINSLIDDSQAIGIAQ